MIVNITETKYVEVIQVIRTHLTIRGEGIAPSDPVRVITQYWDMDGNLLVEIDPYLERAR